MAAGMIIGLEDVNNSEHGELYVGSRKRLASCTGVAFVDEGRLLATSLVGKLMYLIRFDLSSGECQVERAVPTRFGGEDVVTDLVAYNGHGTIVTSNCELNSMSRYELDGDDISGAKDLPIRDERAGFCHGVGFSPSGDLICASCIGNGRH